MVNVVINPTTKDYIEVLKNDNLSMFAMNERIKTIIKEYKYEINELLALPYDEKRQKRLFYVVTLVQALYYTMRQNLKEIKNNLDKVRGLRNGTIKEI